MTTIELLKGFLTAYFVEHNPEKGLALVTQDIRCYGFADDKEISGMDALRDMAASDAHRKFMDAQLAIEKEDQISEDNAILKYSLSLHAVTIHGRMAGNSRQTPDGNKLYFLNNSMQNPMQTLHVYEDIARFKRTALAQELLGEYVSGGSCAHCAMADVLEQGILDKTIEINGKWLSLHAERRSWKDQLVVSIYAADVTEQYILGQQLLQSKRQLEYEDAQLQGILQNIACGVCIVEFDCAGHCAITYVSDVLAKMDGVSTTTLVDAFQKEPYHGVARQDVLLVKKIVERLAADGGSDEITFQFQTHRGSLLHIRAVFAAHKKPDGGCTMYITSIDVTERIQLQKQLEDLVENMPSAVCLYRWNGQKLHPLYVSQGFSDLCGEDVKAMLERTKGLDYDNVHPDDLPGLQAFILNNINQLDRPLFYRYRIFNKQRGEYVYIQLTGKVKRQPDGALIAYVNYADVDAEVKAAEEVKREEELLEKTCQMAKIWMFYYHLQDKRIRLSKGLQEDYHLPASIDHFPDGFLSYPVVPKEYHALYRQMVQKVDAGENATTEMPVKLPDGSIRYVRFQWHVTRQEAGKIVEVAGLPVNITGEVTERRRISKERQRLLGGDKKLVAYSITDLQKEIIVEAKDDTLGSGIQAGDTCKEFNAKVISLLLTERDRQHCLEMRDPNYAIRQYEAGVTEWTEDMRWKSENGQVRWRRSVYSVMENSSTGTLYLYCYLYDVMDEKVTQALFAGIQKNLYLRTGILSFVSGYFYDYQGGTATGRLNAIPFDTARKKYAETKVLPEDAAMVLEQSSLENVKKHLTSGQMDFAYVHRTMKDGILRYHRVLYACVPEQSDICVVAVRDITDLVMEGEQKNAELQKALAAANAAAQAKSEFLSRMSHEIRTPMNAIMGMTAIAQDNKSDFLQVSDCLAKIDSSSRYLLTLINDILEMSRIESGRAKLSEERFDFAELMDGIRIVAEPLAQKSEIRMEMSNRTENGSYYGDRIRIQQIMINLIGNALKFTKQYGRVRFEVSALQDTPTKTTFEFTVEDTGIGMSEAFMQKMFEPFSQEDATTTSQYGGSGLGLAISKSLVEAMGGTIEAESMVGIGTNFTVRIPLEKVQDPLLLNPKKMDEISETEQDALLKGSRILMAEDHPMNIMIAKKLLERKGILLTVAENGKIAVETFRNPAVDAFDAILMDIRMPVMDGLEAARQIRAMDRPDAKTIPIIAMTANALEEDRRNSKFAGMNDHLAKPIEPKKMYQAIAQQIARRNI